MKLPENKIVVETSDSFIEKRSKIGNLSIVFDILRNKLYSNTIESIAREISCNARDANREVGKSEIPIEIHFPNAFNNNYKICDNGPGISPERVDKVYMNYGNSTKRDSNEFTGAFGLGSKTPLAYTNQFTIKTTNEENSSTVTRTYIYYIDKSNEGILSLVAEQNLNLPTGTEIIIPVQDKDIQAFIDGTLKSTQYWPIRPILFGISPLPEFPNNIGDLLASGSDWKIFNVKNNNQFNRSKAESLVIIDGIQYKINESFINPEDRWILACNVHLFFGIGDLTLSASRESLQYDDNTAKKINARIKSLQKELSTQIVDIIDNKESYLEAVEFYSFMGNHFYKVLNKKNLTWHGIKIVGPEVSISQPVIKAINVEIKGYSKHKSTYRESVKLSHDTKLHINKNTKIYYNDLDPEHTYRNKNLKALESNSYIQIINYAKGKSYDDFVTDIKAEHNKQFSSPNAMNGYYLGEDNSFIFDVIKPINLSEIIEDKVSPKPKVKTPKVKNNLIKAFKYYSCSSYKLRDHFIKTSLDKDVEGYYLETNFSDNSIILQHSDKQKWSFITSDLPSIKHIVGDAVIYSIKQSDISKFTKLKPLADLLEEKYLILINLDYYKSKALRELYNNYSSPYYNYFNNFDLRSFVKNKNNKMLIRNSSLLEYTKYSKYSENDTLFDFIPKMDNILNRKINIELYQKSAEYLLDEIKNRYPLLVSLYNTKDNLVLDYINMCDEFYDQKQLKMAVGK